MNERPVENRGRSRPQTPSRQAGPVRRPRPQQGPRRPLQAPTRPEQRPILHSMLMQPSSYNKDLDKEFFGENPDEEALKAKLEELEDIFEAPGLTGWNELIDLYDYDTPLEVRDLDEDKSYQDFLGKDYPKITYKEQDLELLEWPTGDKGFSEEFSASGWKTGNVYTYKAKARDLKTKEVLNLVWELRHNRPLMDLEIEEYDWGQEKEIRKEDE